MDKYNTEEKENLILVQKIFCKSKQLRKGLVGIEEKIKKIPIHTNWRSLQKVKKIMDSEKGSKMKPQRSLST